jgi:excisionase family DNA binding protein
MGNTTGSAAADEVVRLLRRHGLAGEEVRRVFRALNTLSEEEWEAVMRLLDPAVKEAAKRWLVPVVYHIVHAEMERWYPLVKGPPPLLDVKGVAERLNVSERSVERLVASGQLVPLGVGGARRFSQEGVRAFLRRYAVRRRRKRKKQ